MKKRHLCHTRRFIKTEGTGSVALFSKLRNSQLQAALDQPMCETVAYFAIRVAIADGHLDETDHKTLAGFATQSGGGRADYHRILDVLLMPLRFPNAMAQAG